MNGPSLLVKVSACIPFLAFALLPEPARISWYTVELAVSSQLCSLSWTTASYLFLRTFLPLVLSKAIIAVALIIRLGQTLAVILG